MNGVEFVRRRSLRLSGRERTRVYMGEVRCVESTPFGLFDWVSDAGGIVMLYII